MNHARSKFALVVSRVSNNWIRTQEWKKKRKNEKLRAAANVVCSSGGEIKKEEKKTSACRIDAAVRPSRPGRLPRLDIGSFFLDSLRRSTNRVIILPKVDNVADNHLRWMGNRTSFFSHPSDLRVLPIACHRGCNDNGASIAWRERKKNDDDSACAFWTRDARYQECVMRSATVLRQKVMRKRIVPRGCDAIRRRDL